ncbi:hypothetical protein AYO44_06025 [Planctomycetaceae bacterium SCGC AG-212-F19]|nr:hypothetical protein AYO44_06025 [Planctomycetaceae bacterium SCGC AG-212-F19]
MLIAKGTFAKGLFIALVTVAVLALFSGTSSAQQPRPQPIIQPNPFPFPFPFFPPQPQPQPVQAAPAPFTGVNRMTNSLANPLNFQQYGQTTGVGPIRGTVRIYNTFGILDIQGGGGLAQGFQAGQQVGQGFGGQANTAGSGNIPGIGATQGGDDPPQGVLLHVQYASLFFPNQRQINQNAFQTQAPIGGGFGGFPGQPFGQFGGGGKSQFNGNGGAGL